MTQYLRRSPDTSPVCIGYNSHLERTCLSLFRMLLYLVQYSCIIATVSAQLDRPITRSYSSFRMGNMQEAAMQTATALGEVRMPCHLAPCAACAIVCAACIDVSMPMAQIVCGIVSRDRE